jgi:hypothetical protein
VETSGDCAPTPAPPTPPVPTPPPTAPPTPPPTAPPTPAPQKYSCNTGGQCYLDSKGTQTAGECTDSCKCIEPHNCGQLNGTTVCGKVVTTCNVCDTCCVKYRLDQIGCNMCVRTAPQPKGAPTTGGCGWNNATARSSTDGYAY